MVKLEFGTKKRVDTNEIQRALETILDNAGKLYKTVNGEKMSAVNFSFSQDPDGEPIIRLDFDPSITLTDTEKAALLAKIQEYYPNIRIL